jgi:hypothetical protein
MPVGSHATGGALAPLAAGWDRWRRGEAFGAPAASPMGGDVPGSIKVELYIAEAWVDVTRLDTTHPGVYYRDDIDITRGRPDESSTVNPGTCTFTLNNRDGRFSPRNPLSPYFGLLGRNTPVRVSIVQANGVRRYRFHGEVSSWPQKWDQSGTDVYVPVEAAGILRRLNQGATLSGSALYRGITKHATNLVAYWPCEDAVGSTYIAPGISGVSAMAIKGTPTLASVEDYVASDPIPVMGSASFTGTVPNYSTTAGQNAVRFLLAVPAAGATNGQIITAIYASGTVARWELYYGTGGSLGLRGFDGTGSSVTDTGFVAFAIDGKDLLVGLDISTSGTGIAYSITTIQVGSTSGSTTSGTLASNTIGRITSVVMAPDRGLTATAIGHVHVQNLSTSLFAQADPLKGYAGEYAADRIERLCAEEGINYTRAGREAFYTTAMGIQHPASLTTLLGECVASDMGVLLEPRDQVGLAYRDHESLYIQTAKLALDYSAAQLAAPLDPVDDDQRTVNDITVTRTDGSSKRATQSTGPLGVTTIGQYGTSLSLSLYNDTQLPDQAGWRLHMGTTNEARYPTIKLNLAHRTFTTSEAMMSAALTLDLGDRVTISNPPAWLAPDQISLIVEGISERKNGIEHEMTLACSPESPFHVALYDDSTYRYTSDGSTLGAAYSATDTSLSVVTPTGPVWSVLDGSFDIIVGGERMTVTGISGTTSPQTFTVTRSVNGIVKTQLSGATVELFKPSFYAVSLYIL